MVTASFLVEKKAPATGDASQPPDNRPAIPAPRKCDTPRCDHPPCPTDHDPEGIEQTHWALPAWVWTCPCGWRRVQPVNSA